MMGFTASLLHVVGHTPRSAHHAPFGRVGVAHTLVFRARERAHRTCVCGRGSSGGSYTRVRGEGDASSKIRQTCQIRVLVQYIVLNHT